MKINDYLKSLSVLCFFVLIFSACTDKFDEINTDRNSVATVGSAELPFLFAKAEASAVPNIWNYHL